MSKRLLLIMLIVTSFSASAQELVGTWVMAHVKAKQPVYVMVQKDGQLELDESELPDSTITYNAGLMTMEIIKEDSAISYSWDGQESWDIETIGENVSFLGLRDTLYGQFDNMGSLVLKSTIDEIPIEYIFEPLKFKSSKTLLDIENTTWQISGDDSYLKGQDIVFHADSVLTSTYLHQSQPGEYFIHPLADNVAIEFSISTPSHHVGIIYLTSFKQKKMTGVFFSNDDEDMPPRRLNLKFKKIK